MAYTDLSSKLEQIIEPVAEAHGYELVAVEQAGGHKAPVIRVLLDREGGIDLDAICQANAWVDESIENSGLLRGTYTLEVSSPGIDRPLRKPSDYERFAGETVTVKAKPSGSKRSAWTGTLLGLKDDVIALEVDGENVDIPLESVVKARLKGVVSFKRERGAE